jgi:hypothetical protein
MRLTLHPNGRLTRTFNYTLALRFAPPQPAQHRRALGTPELRAGPFAALRGRLSRPCGTLWGLIVYPAFR